MDNNEVDPRTYLIALTACGPEATTPQIGAMVRRLEAFYAKQPRALVVHDLARRTGDDELRRFLATINGLPKNHTAANT